MSEAKTPPRLWYITSQASGVETIGWRSWNIEPITPRHKNSKVFGNACVFLEYSIQRPDGHTATGDPRAEWLRMIDDWWR